MALSELIRKFGNEFVGALEKNLPASKDASGKLRGSIKVRFKFFTDSYEAQILMEDYYKWVDKGRPAGKLPPFDAIARWVNTKKTLGRTGTKGIVTKNKRLGTLGVVKKTVIIDRIRWGIYKRGIKPVPFFTKTMKLGFVSDFKNQVAKEYKKDIIVEIKTWQ